MSNSFLTIYNNIICPKLKSIDIAIKATYENIDPKTISSILDISQKELSEIIKVKHIHRLCSQDIPTIMLNGSSYICKIFRKTLNVGCPTEYTALEISYIYNIDYALINEACTKLNKYSFKEDELPLLFEHISFE